MSKTNENKRSRSSTGRRYDENFKRDAARLCQDSGRSRAQIARELGVSQVSLAAWEARYGTEGAVESPRSTATRATEGPLSAVAALAEVARLQAELDYMTRQRDILKKAMSIMGQEPRSAFR